MVNGPQDGTLPRDAIDWRLHEENVRRLRQRIFKAAKDGSLATVRDLQKLMLRSWSSTLVSVRQATQLNAGRKTAGAGGLASGVQLRCLAHADQRAAPAPQHEFLQVPDRGQGTILRRLEDPLPEPPYVLLMQTPVNGIPGE